MTHYEALGVSITATQQELKAAYRKQSSKCHPDKGTGDSAKMAQINRAYDVLSNIILREQYDATGDDAPRTPFEVRAQQTIMELFAAAIQQDVPEMLVFVRGKLEDHQAAMLGNVVKAQQARTKWEAKKAQISTRSGPNAMHMVVDQQIRALESQTFLWGEDASIVGMALAMLEQYNTTEQPPPQLINPAMTAMQYFSNTGNTPPKRTF